MPRSTAHSAAVPPKFPQMLPVGSHGSFFQLDLSEQYEDEDKGIFATSLIRNFTFSLY